MAGPKGNLKAGWDLIRKGGIEIDPPTPRDHCLRYGQTSSEIPGKVFDERTGDIRPMLPRPNTEGYKKAKDARRVRWGMLGFTDQCIERCLECVA